MPEPAQGTGVRISNSYVVSGRKRIMIGKILALTITLLFTTQAYTQTIQGSGSSASGTTSGPAAGSATSMRSPQAGPLETKHQQKTVRDQSRSVRNNTDRGAHHQNYDDAATNSSSPSYAPPPR